MSSQNHRFPPIGSYGFLSDCHTAALVSFGGSVEWLCTPRFDSASTFAAILDRGAGHMSLRPKDVIVPISRRYVPGTLVIETTWVTDTGWVVVKDALTIADWAASGEDPGDRRGRPDTAHESDSSLLRTITCIDGEVEMDMECLPRFDYGAEAASWSGGKLGEAAASAADGTELLLTSDLELQLGEGAVHGTVTLREDETAF
ncbi:MAG TPA: trehalase-like domain-containing protein, partial [Solirubrobacterales bacterium]|nr:trehalase-like domain-containing protein [Solirubrobacterales bacterium]